MSEQNVSSENQGSDGAATDSAKTSRPKAAKILPTDRIRFDKQLDILRAFAAASGHEKRAVTGKDVGVIVDMAESTITQITPFLVDIGLIIREKKAESKGFTPSPEVFAYQKAYEWDKLNAGKKLAPVLATSWFTETLTPKLKFRPVNEKEAVHDLGEVAVVGPDKEVGLRTIIDYLVVAGIVERDTTGMLRAGNVSTESSRELNKPPADIAPKPPLPAAVSGVKEHQLWLLEILNAYPDLPDTDQDAILKLIKTIKAGVKNASPATNE
jgi:hypothetical protein